MIWAVAGSPPGLGSPSPEHHQQQQEQQQLHSTTPIRRPSKPFDSDWVSEAEAANRNDLHMLRGRLSSAQSHLHKEAIRTAFVALAQHYLQTGHLRDALASLVRAVDYSTSRSQSAHISLFILEVSFGLGKYSMVRNYVNKLQRTIHAVGGGTSGGIASSTGITGTGNIPSNTGAASNSNWSPSVCGSLQDVNVKLSIARGLDSLANGDYAAAATCFANLAMTTSSSQMDWPAVVSAADVALYASVLTMATQSRAAILELSEHPEALELVPGMKDLLTQWSRANYAKCLESVAAGPSAASSASGNTTTCLVPQGDLYLSGHHWKVLRTMIQEKCLLEYLKPYQCVRLDTMAQLFPSITNLEETLVDLIDRGLMMDTHAKIDCRANILFKTQPKTTIPLETMERHVLDDTHAMLIRLACLEHEIQIKDTTSRGRRLAAAAADPYYDGGNNNNDGHDDDDDVEVDDDDIDQGGDVPMMDADAMNVEANPEDLY